MAKVHQLAVVTRNVSDFSRFDIPLLNPFVVSVKTIQRGLFVLWVAGCTVHARECLERQDLQGGGVEPLVSDRLQQPIEGMAVGRHHTAGHK